AARCMKEIFLPTVAAMNKEGRPFKGCLYFGLMLTKDGPKVIEYNCRFGDPETQVVLPLLESDLFTVMRSVTEERLAETEVRFQNRHACCVILASKGYPEAYDKGFALEIPEAVRAQVYVAGAARKDGRLVTNGGRVVGCTAVADTLQDAVRGAYAVAAQVSFENKYCRRDIGARALAAVQEG
ncbi:MAG: phosphoribosylamine--glycine ligase, partial [Lachnospiraceae bacterium]|nr:phosphoribosylamine--glycine ligase [Lachnospiraceae bacterium]